MSALRSMAVIYSRQRLPGVPLIFILPTAPLLSESPLRFSEVPFSRRETYFRWQQRQDVFIS